MILLPHRAPPLDFLELVLAAVRLPALLLPLLVEVLGLHPRAGGS